MNFWDRIAAEKHLLSYPQAPYGPLGLLSPNEYSIGITGLGFQQVYRLFRNSGFSVERIFFDPKGRETRSVENQTPLFRFPFLAASFTYELDILNLINMLIRGGVSPLADARGDGAPLLILGGLAATANPPLLSKIADAIVIGEGERTVEALAQSFVSTWGMPRNRILESLVNIPHVYVPSVHGEYDRTRFPFHTLSPLEAYPCHTVIQAEDDEFGGAFLLEVSRGCTYRCQFCIVHYMTGSGRYRQYDSLIDILDKHQEHYRKVGLLGAAVADHPQVEDLAEWLVSRGKQVSTSSLRAEKITERFLDLLKAGGQHNLTVAPEAGSTERRIKLLKGVKDEKYFRMAEWAGQRRFPQIKLYFLLGLPESDPLEEAEEIIQFVGKMHEIFIGHGGGRIVVSLSPFVPKPTTGWEAAPTRDAKTVKKAARRVRKVLAFRSSIKVPPVNVKEARLETLLSQAGSEFTADLIRLAQREISLEQVLPLIAVDS